VAGIIQTSLRQIDVVGRYGGEEFVVLLPETARMTALAVAKRLCTAVAAQSVELHGECLPITISIGVAVGFGDAALNLEELLERADRALYAAKATGRNRVAVWPLVDAG
jgi:diguanylate cyclase (GGDEF)-like protein